MSAFQSYGEKVYDRITEEERKEIVRNSCPGPGACGGMYTANTMATAIEAMGMSLPYSSSTPADDEVGAPSLYFRRALTPAISSRGRSARWQATPSAIC